LTVGSEMAGERAEQRLGRLDLVKNPEGQTRWFRNAGVAAATFMRLSGIGPGGEVRFAAA